MWWRGGCKAGGRRDCGLPWTVNFHETQHGRDVESSCFLWVIFDTHGNLRAGRQTVGTWEAPWGTCSSVTFGGRFRKMESDGHIRGQVLTGRGKGEPQSAVRSRRSWGRCRSNHDSPLQRACCSQTAYNWSVNKRGWGVQGTATKWRQQVSQLEEWSRAAPERAAEECGKYRSLRGTWWKQHLGWSHQRAHFSCPHTSPFSDGLPKFPH